MKFTEDTISIKEINEMKKQPGDYRRRAAIIRRDLPRFKEEGERFTMKAVANDYEAAADSIERLLNHLGLPAYD